MATRGRGLRQREELFASSRAASLHSNGICRLLSNNGHDSRVFGVFEIVTF